MTSFYKQLLYGLFSSLLTLILVNSRLYAQNNTNLVSTYYQKGLSAFESSDIDSAEYYFEEVLELDENNLKAKAGLGKVAYTKKNWGNVLSFFEEIEDADTSNLEALYYIGIAYRERAKSKVLWLRWWDFEEAAEYFDRVIAQDSLYRDIFYQYAYLKRCEEEYPASIEYSQKQIELKPDSVELYINHYKLYMNFVRNVDQYEYLRWANKVSYPEAQLFSAEVHRRNQRYMDALKILNKIEFDKTSLPVQLVKRGFFKVYYEKGDVLLAEKYYWDAVNAIDGKLGASILFQDIKYIISSHDYKYFHNINNPDEFRYFFKRYWAVRDPLPASKFNERLKEHYERLAYAEDNYEYDGFRTWFNNPDKYRELTFPFSYYLNNEFNDKGLIFIRYGRADEWVITADSDIRNESWKYHETNNTPSMLFHFLNETAGYNWRLAPYLMDQKLVEDRFSIDPLAYRMYSSDNILDRESIRYEMLEKSLGDVETVFETEKSTWISETKALNFYIDLATFRGDSNKTVSELYYYIPGNQFPKTEVVTDMIIECGLSISDTLHNVIHQERKNISIRGVGNHNTAWIDFFRVNLDPGEYNFGIHIRNTERDLLGAYKFNSTIENYHKPFLSMSSIYKTNMVSSARQEGIAVSKGVLIQPNPSNFFDINKPLHLFFELYNLTIGRDDSTDYKIEISAESVEGNDNIFDDIAGIFGSSENPTELLTISKTGGHAVQQEMISVNLGDLDAGSYNLHVKVTDNILKIDKERIEKIDIYESDL